MFLESRELIGYGNVDINRSLYPQRSFVKTVLRGDLGLARTFWLYLFIVGVFINIGMVMIPELSIEIRSILILLACTVYALPLHISVWRAADKYRGPKIWAILAKLNIKIHLFVFICAIVLSVVFIYVDDYLSHV